MPLIITLDINQIERQKAPFNKIFYGILLILTVEIPLAVVVILLLNKPNIATAKRSTKLLKFCTLGGLFSIYIGTI